ncbi:MAG: hypothetical protein ACYC9J_14575 [Sulfuricaulis sp.]
MPQSNDIAEWCSQYKNGWHFLFYYAFMFFIVLAIMVIEVAYKTLRNGMLLVPVIFLALAWFDVGAVRQVSIQAPHDGVRVAIKHLCYGAFAGGFVVTIAEAGIRDLHRFINYKLGY